jgi:hypothetical protein
MIICHLRYVIAPGKLKEFEEYGRRWTALIKKYGGTHYGYFFNETVPDRWSSFSYPGLGSKGPTDVSISMFSFPTFEAYETYRRDVANDKECKAITAHFHKTKCFVSYERSFMKPLEN